MNEIENAIENKQHNWISKRKNYEVKVIWQHTKQIKKTENFKGNSGKHHNFGEICKYAGMTKDKGLQRDSSIVQKAAAYDARNRTKLSIMSMPGSLYKMSDL